MLKVKGDLTYYYTEFLYLPILCFVVPEREKLDPLLHSKSSILISPRCCGQLIWLLDAICNIDCRYTSIQWYYYFTINYNLITLPPYLARPETTISRGSKMAATPTADTIHNADTTTNDDESLINGLPTWLSNALLQDNTPHNGHAH